MASIFCNRYNQTMRLNIKNPKHILILIGLSFVCFMLGNNILSLTSPDEVFYAQTAKEMIQHKSWMSEYLFGAPQFEKPIFTYWLLRIGFAIFGVSSFGARFFPALFAMIGIVAVYILGVIGFKDEKKAFLSALVLMSSALYIGLARTVFTDMIFSIFILLSLLSFFWGYSIQEKKDIGILLFFIFSGLAVLTKGPLGILIPLLTVCTFLLIRKDIKWLFCKYSLWGFLIFALISIPWYFFMIKRYGSDFIHEFFYNDHIRRIIEAEHLGCDTWYFYPLSMIACMFPWSLHVLTSLIYLFKNYIKEKEPVYTFLICWICVVFIIFQSAHSKLVSYIFPMFPALALVCGNFLHTTTLHKSASRSFLFGSFATAIVLLLFPVGLNVSAVIYAIYIPSKTAIYLLSAVLLFISVLFLILIIRRKLFLSFCILASFIPVILFSMPFMYKYAEPYVSSKTTCEYLLKNFSVDNTTILCSKSFTRGVRFYTDKEVAVIDIKGKSFFSPHPVPFLNSKEKVQSFLDNQPITYCVLKKSYAKDIENIIGKRFKSTLLKVIGDEYILKIEPQPIAKPLTK